jgi:hypothetical protein
LPVSDKQKIIALSILILLYACVPILVFFLIYVGIFDVVNILRFIKSPNIDDGMLSLKYTSLFLAALYILNKLLKWIKK